jgi:hypothetical protein
VCAAPTVLSKWGEEQPELHADFLALFLDLVYVGVAVSLGNMIKHAFYACADGEHAAHASGSTAHASGSTAHASGSTVHASGSSAHSRMLGDDEWEAPPSHVVWDRRMLAGAAVHDGILHFEG